MRNGPQPTHHTCNYTKGRSRILLRGRRQRAWHALGTVSAGFQALGINLNMKALWRSELYQKVGAVVFVDSKFVAERGKVESSPSTTRGRHLASNKWHVTARAQAS